MSQLHMMRANGIGFTNPGRVETWFETVAEYAGTASVVGTVPESCLDETSPTNSRRNSGEVERNGSSVSMRPRNRHFGDVNGQPPKRENSATQRARLSVMETVPEGSLDNLSINHSRSSSEETSFVGPNKAAVIQNTAIKLKHSWSWDKLNANTFDDLATDTASVDETVKEIHSDDVSLPGSMRNSGEFTVVVRPREVLPEVERVQMHHNIGDFVSGGWLEKHTWLQSVTENGGTASGAETALVRAVQLSNSMSLTEFEIRHNIWDGNEARLMLVNNDRTNASVEEDGLLHLPLIIYRCIQYLRYTLHRPWHNISFWPYEIKAYYDEDGLLMLPPKFEAVPGDRRTRAGDLSSDVGGYLWQKFASGHDFNLLNIDWSLWPAPEDTINCVGNLFMQYLYKVHAPIIPPDIGRYFDDPYYFGSFTEFENSLHEPELADDKYLLLCHVLSFLHDVSLAAHRVQDAQRLFAKAFRGLFGVGEEFALHLIVKHREFLTMPEQDGNKNTFAFETSFSSELPLPQTLIASPPQRGLLTPLAPTSLYSPFPLPLGSPHLIHEKRATATELSTTEPRPKNPKYKPPGVTEALYLIKRRHDLCFTQWVPPEPVPEPKSRPESDFKPELGPASSLPPSVAQPPATYTYLQLSDEDKTSAVELGDSYLTPKSVTFGFSEQHTLYLIGRRQDTSFNIPFAEWCQELAAVWESVLEPQQSPPSTVAPPLLRPISHRSYMNHMSHMSPANDNSYGGSLIISKVETPTRPRGTQWPTATPLTSSQLDIPSTTAPTTCQLALPATIPATVSRVDLPIWGGAAELPTKPSEGMRFWDPSCEPWTPTPVPERRQILTVLMHRCNSIAAFKIDHSCMTYCCWEPANEWLKSCNRNCSSCLRALKKSHYTPYAPAKPKNFEYMY